MKLMLRIDSKQRGSLDTASFIEATGVQEMQDYSPLFLGAHLSSSEGLSRGLTRADEMGLKAIQVYTRSNKRWFTTPIEPEEVLEFRRISMRFDPSGLMSHASRLINLASPDAAIHKRSMDALYDELVRAEALGLNWVVLHPGDHGGQGEQIGIRHIIVALNTVLTRTRHFRVGILLENLAGTASEIGGDLEHLAKIRQRSEQRDKIAFCLDLCHLFSAGYDIRDLVSYRQTMREIQHHIGLRNIKAIHMTDSKFELGSKTDGHACIGRGEIGQDAFAFVVNDKNFQGVPMLLEPVDGCPAIERVSELRLLSQLVGVVSV